jgi:hypothetical protein
MLKKIIYVAVILIFLSPVMIQPHGNEKGNKKVEKVTVIQGEKGYVSSDSLAKAEKQKSMEKGFAEIRKDVEKSTVPTIIKALSLAVILAGFAFLYFPKKKKETADDES